MHLLDSVPNLAMCRALSPVNVPRTHGMEISPKNRALDRESSSLRGPDWAIAMLLRFSCATALTSIPQAQRPVLDR